VGKKYVAYFIRLRIPGTTAVFKERKALFFPQNRIFVFNGLQNRIPLFLKAFCLTCKFLTASVCEMTPSLRIVEQTSLPPNSVHIGAMVHHGNSLRLAAFQFVWVLKRSACVSNAVWPNTSKNIPMLSEIDTFFLWPTMAE